MPEEMRWRRPGREVGVGGRVVGRETAVVVAARVRIGREKFGVARVVSSVAATVWACGRRGRWNVVVAPYIVMDGAARKREEVEYAGVFASFAAFWREARSWGLLFVDDILVEGSRSRLLLGSALLLEKELPIPRVWLVVGGGCRSR
jgi:hypothetical protein